MAAALVTIPAVPIARVGVWQTSTGEWNCTTEQLRSAVAAEASGLFRTPILKIGHDDARFTDGQPLGDGTPAVGRLERLRVVEDGTLLVADLVGVPAWLGEIAASAYPSRSIEAAIGVPRADGGEWPMVVTGLALLGVTPPAIESLGDIADLYGIPRGVEDYIAAARSSVAAAALPGEGAMPVRPLGTVVIASAAIEELASAAEKWAEDQPALGDDCWVRDIYTDSLIFSSWRGDEVSYWRTTWTEADGAFTFGAPEKVRPTYEPVPTAAGVAAGALLSSRAPRATQQTGREVPAGGSGTVLSPRGRVTARDNSQETHVPISPALAAELGVPEDADDATVLEAVTKLRTPTPAPPAPSTEEGETTTDAPADVAQLVNAAVQKHTAPILAALQTTSQELAALKAKDAKGIKDGVIGDALTAGKIKPADKADWEKRYDAAPEVITEVLASLAKGTAVHVTASGHTGGEVTGSNEPFSDEDYERHFGTAEKAGL